MKNFLSILLIALTFSTQAVLAQYSPAGGGTGSALNNGQIWVGNGSNQAAAVTPSGGATISNAGVVTLANPSSSTLGGIQSFAFQASQWISSISTSGVPSATQPAFSDISGSATLAQFPTEGNNTVLGNVSGSTTVPVALTATQLTTIPNVFTSGLKGLVPASGGGTTNFLRADGTFAAPSAGAVSSVSNSDGTITASPTTGAVVVSIPSSVALAGSPTTTTQATTDNSTKIATTAYVTTGINNAIAGVNPAVAVQAATAAVLPNTPTYNNGVAGIGATLTSSTNSVLVVDGYTPLLNDRILAKNQATAANNGVYTVTQLGVAAVTPWILTRALDFDQSSDINNTGAVPVVNGTANATTSWVVTSKVNTVGTDAVTFSQFSIAPTTIQTTTLNSANIWVGNGSNVATGVALSGDATLANTGALTLVSTAVSAGSYTNTNLTVDAKGRITSASNGSSSSSIIAPQGRLTLSSTLPVTTTDITGATSIFYLPYVGRKVTLWDSTHSATITDDIGNTGITIALTGLSSGMYDVYVADATGSGTAGLVLVAWTNNTTRATGLVYGTHLGELVESGTEANLFLGSVFLTATGTTEQTAGDCALANYYNVKDLILRGVQTANWSLNSATWRGANNNTTNGAGRCSFVTCVAEQPVNMTYAIDASVATNTEASIGINLNSSTATPTVVSTSQNADTVARKIIVNQLVTVPAIGYNFVQAMEATSGNLTFNNGSVNSYSFVGWVKQ